MAAKSWRERLNLSALTDETQEEYLRARRRRGFSRPLIFVVVVVAAIFVLSLFFRVEDITVEGNTHYTDEEIIRAIDIEEGDNLFFFDRIAAFYCQFFKSHVFSPAPMHSCASSSNSPSFLSPCPKSSAIRSICSVRYKYPIRASNPVAIL